MKGLKLILATIATLLSTTYAATYYAAQPANTAGSIKLAIQNVSPALTATQIALPKSDGTGWEGVECTDRTQIEAALALDSYDVSALATVQDGVKKGSCCINAHHEACISIQDQLRSVCEYSGKGDDSILKDGTNCPA